MARHFSGRKLKDARLVAGVSRRELATQLGSSYKTLASYEQGIRVPSVLRAAALADAIGVRLDDLLEDV